MLKKLIIRLFKLENEVDGRFDRINNNFMRLTSPSIHPEFSRPRHIDIIETRRQIHLIESKKDVVSHGLYQDDIRSMEATKEEICSKIGIELFKMGFVKFEAFSIDNYRPYESRVMVKGLLEVVEPKRD